MSINGKGTGKGIKNLINVGSYIDKHGKVKQKWPSEETLSAKYASRRRCARKVRAVDEQGEAYYVDVLGKTVRDHKSGAWGQRFGNRTARQNWLNDKQKVSGWPAGNHIPGL